MLSISHSALVEFLSAVCAQIITPFFVVFEHFQWVSRLYLFLCHLHSCPLKLALQTRCYVTVFLRTQVQIQARVSKTLYLVWMKGINTQNHSSWKQKHCREAKARTQTSSKGMWQSWNQEQEKILWVRIQEIQPNLSLRTWYHAADDTTSNYGAGAQLPLIRRWCGSSARGKPDCPAP